MNDEQQAQGFESVAKSHHRQAVTPKHMIQHDAESESTFRYKELAGQKREQASKNKRDDNTAHKIQKSRGASGYGEPKLGGTIRRAAAKDSSLASMASSVRSEVSSLKSAAATGAGNGAQGGRGDDGRQV